MKNLIIFSLLSIVSQQTIFANTLLNTLNSPNSGLNIINNETNMPSLIKTKTINKGNKELDFSKSDHISQDFKQLNAKDVSLSLSYSKEKKSYLINFNKYDESLFNIQDLLPLSENNSESFVHIYWINSLLSSFYEQEISLNNNLSNQYFISIPKMTNKCNAFYITYHLNGEKYATTQRLILGKNGTPVEKMDASCPRPYAQDQEELAYTSSSYIVGTHWNTPILTTYKPTSFQATFTKEGKEVLPNHLHSYAVSKNYEYFYIMKQTQNNSGLHKMDYGIQFSNFITYPETYYFNIQFETDNGKNNSFVNIKNVLDR